MKTILAILGITAVALVTMNSRAATVNFIENGEGQNVTVQWNADDFLTFDPLESPDYASVWTTIPADLAYANEVGTYKIALLESPTGPVSDSLTVEWTIFDGSGIEPPYALIQIDFVSYPEDQLPPLQDGVFDETEVETGGLQNFNIPIPGESLTFGIQSDVEAPADPATAIQQLADAVAAMNLRNGIENSLDAKLDSALNALDDVNEHDDAAACNSLDALINAVEAQRGNKLTDDQADQLIGTAQQIQALLNCGQ